MLNAQWLETFTVLCETGHFTRTAELRGMTQPGVSQHLRKLENQVGQALLSRQGRSLSPTPAGEAVLAVGRARRIEEKALRQSVLGDDPGVGEVSIACSGSFAVLLYPCLFPSMQASSDLTIRLEAAPQDTVLAGVLDGRFDLGVVDHEPRHPRLDAELLGQEELCLIVPRDTSPLPPSFETLDAMGLVAHPDAFAYADDLFSLNFPATFRGSEHLNVRTFINQISQIPSPVGEGLGYTLLPRSGVDAYPYRAKFRIVPLPEKRHHELWLIMRRGRVYPARVRAVADIVRSAALSLGAP